MVSTFKSVKTGNKESTVVQQQGPKYQLRKITSKYLILEIMSFAGYREETFEILTASKKNLRNLLIEQHTLYLQST